MSESNQDRNAFEQMIAEHKAAFQRMIDQVSAGTCDHGLQEAKPSVELKRLKASVIAQLNALIKAVDELDVDQVDQAVSNGKLAWKDALNRFREQTRDFVKFGIRIGALPPKEPTPEELAILERIKTITAQYFAILTELTSILESPEGQDLIKHEVQEKTAGLQSELQNLEEAILGDLGKRFSDSFSSFTNDLAGQFGNMYTRLIPLWKKLLPQIQTAHEAYVTMLAAGKLDEEKLNQIANQLQKQLDDCSAQLQHLKQKLDK